MCYLLAGSAGRDCAENSIHGGDAGNLFA